DDDRRGVTTLFGKETASQRRADAKNREEVRGHEPCAERLTFAGPIPDHHRGLAGECPHLAEITVVVAVVLVLWKRELHIAADAAAAPGVVLPDFEQSVRLGDRRGAQKQPIN